MIRWSDDGNSFIVLDEDEFARTLIPELFKHNNYASFVRQLNMYGFHKKVGLSDNSMRASERKNKSPSEYSNPYFKRGQPDLLWLIQKPKNTAGQGSKGAGKAVARVRNEPEAEDGESEEFAEDIPAGYGTRDDRPRPRQLSIAAGEGGLAKDQLSNVYRELQAIRHQQQIISGTITKLRREHEQLYGQAANFQEQHSRHENSINAILTFLATVYNRSLNGHEGAQGIASNFAGAIPQEQNQGNVVDVDDFDLGSASSDLDAAQRPYKKTPLLLKAPPVVPGGDTQPQRARTVGPSSANSSPYGSSHSRRQSHVHQTSHSRNGSVEEVFDPTSPQTQNVADEHTQQPQQAQSSHQNQQHQHQRSQSQPSQEAHDQSRHMPPQRDIMSVIQRSNARNNLSTNISDFPNVLSSLETSGGNSPLTPNQRADMLRLINSTSNPDSSTSNNALISPNPPPMPHNYPDRLANTRAEIDNLVKMQAEQDRSVQNLTDLLQPLSPTGAIPGLSGDAASGNVPPPPLDLDQIFNSGDYFGDFADLDKTGGITEDLDFAHNATEEAQQRNNRTSTAATAAATGNGNTQNPNQPQNAGLNININDPTASNNQNSTGDLFNFDGLPGGSLDNHDDLFESKPLTAGNQTSQRPQHVPGYFGSIDGLPQNGGSGMLGGVDGIGGAGAGVAGAGIHAGAAGGPDGGRVVETFTSSEGTSPANTSVDDNIPGISGGSGGRSPVKRRKQNR